MNQKSSLSIRALITLLALIQFINVVDFMMVMPLGPDFARALGFPVTSVGLVGGAYSFASAIIGFIAALVVDHVARKRALLLCIGGLILTTLAAAAAWNLESMIAARLLAGMFGGPIWGLCSAFAADAVAPEQRGRAIGAMMGAFSAASVLGVPFGLQLAHWFGWQAPFIVISALAALTWLAMWRLLPYHKPYAAPMSLGERMARLGTLLQSRLVWAAYGCSAVAMIAGFLLIPNIAAFVQMNMGYPRDDLGLLYLAGGAVSFFTQRAAGWLVDRTTATLTSILFAILFVANLYQSFVLELATVPVIISFILFMVSMSGRGVAAQTLASKVPPPEERGSFMSIQGALINVASASGAYVSSLVLVESNGRLLHVDTLATASIILSCLVPLLFWYVERRVKGHAH